MDTPPFRVWATRKLVLVAHPKASYFFFRQVEKKSLGYPDA